MKFSIIIPTYQRLARLEVCLKSIAALRYPVEQYEVIVVDDGSGSPPTTLVDGLAKLMPARLLVQNHAGPAAARNTGAAAARGQFLVFTDDDCAPHPDWLATLADQLSISPECAVGGRTINALSSPYSVASQDLVSYLYAHFNRLSNEARFFTSNNMIAQADKFKAIGGFDRYFPFAAAEDRDFFDRWLAAGYEMVYVAEAVIYHSHALTFAAFWRQHFNYGRGAYRFHRLRAARANSAIRLEPLSFYINLLVFPLRQNRGYLAGTRVTLLTVLSQIANAAGYFWERWMEKP